MSIDLVEIAEQLDTDARVLELDISKIQQSFEDLFGVKLKEKKDWSRLYKTTKNKAVEMKGRLLHIMDLSDDHTEAATIWSIENDDRLTSLVHELSWLVSIVPSVDDLPTHARGDKGRLDYLVFKLASLYIESSKRKPKYYHIPDESKTSGGDTKLFQGEFVDFLSAVLPYFAPFPSIKNENVVQSFARRYFENIHPLQNLHKNEPPYSQDIRLLMQWNVKGYKE